MLQFAHLISCILSAFLPSQMPRPQAPSPTHDNVGPLLQRWEAEGRFHQKPVEVASICDGSTPSAGRI
jgi:hypothetical protein